jgi:hypothetical protein
MVPALGDVVVWLGAAVLAVAGVGKVRHPVPAALFVRRLGIPATPASVRAGAVVETAVGLLVLTVGGTAAPAAAALIYAAFLAALAGYVIRTGERSFSCGCFGGSAPVAILPHAAALLAALVATAASAIAGRDALLAVLGSLTLAEATMLLVLLALTVVVLVASSPTTSDNTPSQPAFRLTAAAPGDGP